MNWKRTDRTDQRTRAIADRHYSRKKIGSAGFVQPGRCIVLLSLEENAYWVSSWPHSEYVKHAWPTAWQCTAFRNEGTVLSSTLITQAVQATRAIWGAPPEIGMITFVDTTKVRKKRDFGRCFLRAGFKHLGYTKAGLLALQLKPEDMPEPRFPYADKPISKEKLHELFSEQLRRSTIASRST